MEMSENKPGAGGLSRRDFLRSTAAVGAGLMLAGKVLAQDGATETKPEEASASPSVGLQPDTLNIALIGCGAQGQVLMEAIRKIVPGGGNPNIRFKAVCDIYGYNLQRVSRGLKAYGHTVNAYEDYRELLDKEKDLHAVVVATPDWMHAEHAIASMEAGHHVYCEKEMSNSLEKAKQMVLTSRRTGKLLQIGHQRRSSPRYIHAVNNIVHGNRILGRVCQANAQWNRAVTADETWVEKYALPADKLNKYGYDSMHQLRNWRWFRKYGGGPIVDLGSHQIDIFAWVFQGNPVSVMASGGMDYYKNHEWYDTVMAVFEYATPEGSARAFYQVLTTSSYGLYYEAFMGENGTLQISELSKKTIVGKEKNVAPGEWDKWVNAGVLKRAIAEAVPAPAASTGAVVDVRESPGLEPWEIPIQLLKPYHQYHLENFFSAILHGTPLNCPPEVGYESAVAVLTVNKAVEAGKTITFKPEDFTV
jgi:predicted dehydrogenase